MPELPDLVHIERVVGGALAGRRVVDVRTGDPTVLRLMVRETLPELLTGRKLEKVTRRGQFLTFAFRADAGDAVCLVVNAMLAGRYFVDVGDEPRRGKNFAIALGFEGGAGLRFVDETRMAKVYVAPEAKLGEIPVYANLGVEILSPAFTLDAFRKLAKRRRDQVRQFLMDKTALAAIGNAYADEILFAAQLHPKTFVNKLPPEEIDRLYRAIVEVTRDAIAEVARRNEPVDVKVRDFLKVRGRAGKPCPVCGTVIREVRVGDGDACFCPQCQPAARKLFVDWGKVPPK